MHTITRTNPAPVALTADSMALIGRTLADLRGIRHADAQGAEATPAGTNPTGTPAPAPPATQVPTPTPPAAQIPTPAEVPPAINAKTGKPYTAAETQEYIATIRAEAKTNREARVAAEAKATAAEAQRDAVLAALGLGPDGKDLPKDAAALEATLATERTAREDQARENIVLRVSLDPQINANADRLLDSRAFATKLSALKPDDRDGITALVKTTIAENPTWKNSPPAAQSSGSTTHTGPAPVSQRRSMGDAVKAKLQAGAGRN